MANEIKQTASLQCTNGNFKFPKVGGSSNSITQTTRGGGVPGFLAVTTAGVDVSTTGLTNVGWTYIKNLDATNYLSFGPKIGGTFYPIGRLLPGEEITLRLDKAVVPSTTTLHLKANTADVTAQVNILNE